MASKLFRQEVIEAGRDRLTGAVIAATPPNARLYTTVAGGFALLIAFFLSVGIYSTTVSVRGLVTNSEGVARVFAPDNAEVRSVEVVEGQKVDQGDPLLTISLSPGRDAVGEGMASRLAEIDRQDAELARQEQLASTLGSSEQGTIAEQRANITATVASLRKQRALKQSQLALAQSDHRRAVRLAQEGAGTQRQVEATQDEIIARRLDIESLNERILDQQEALLALKSQGSSSLIGEVRSRSELAGQRAALAGERAVLLRQDRLQLTAPIAGTVGDIAVRPGQRTAPSSAALAVIPAANKLEVELYAPSRAIGFVKPGTKVRLRFDAFPYHKYGTGHGTITWVSQVPTEPVGIEADASGAPVFRIRARIDEASFGGRIAGQPLRAGMTLSANLVLETRNLWEVFFEPVLKAVRT
jgi:membrane fusion protein